MDDGIVTQFGPTADIYRTPATLTAARVFSDPPINFATVSKRGDSIRLADNVSWKVSGEAAQLGDGDYQVAVRPNHIHPTASANRTKVKLPGVVQVTELSGSESSAHFQFESQSWVSVASGVHDFQIGEPHTFYMDTKHCFYFAGDGSLVAKGEG